MKTALKRGINPFDPDRLVLHTQVMKTESAETGASTRSWLDAAFGGARRRDEEKSRAKELDFLLSFRRSPPWLGSQEPAARTLARLQYPHQQG